MRPASLSARLTALVLGLLFVALVLIGVTLGLRIQAFAQMQAERAAYGQLALIVQSAQANTTQSTGTQTTAQTGDSATNDSPSDYAYQLYQGLVQSAQSARSWGLLSTASQSYVTDSLSRPLPPASVLKAVARSGRGAWNDLRLLSDGEGNVLGLALNNGDSAALTRGVVGTYAVIAFSVLLLAGVAVLLLLRVGLRPLRVMAAQAARLGVDGAGDLGERMPVGGASDELQLLSVSLNRMLARLQDTFARLSAEEARTRDFAADASHELRTPLTAIAGSLEILERVPAHDDEARARLIFNLRRESRRAGQLVGDLLTLTRLDAGEGLHPQRLELPELLRGVLEVMEDLAPHLTFVLQAPTTLHLTADPQRLEGALLNLLRNAAAHTPAGGTVTLRATSTSTEVQLSVLNPARLDPDFLPRLFDRFARGPDAVAGGSGLGLAIVRAVAQAHRGDAFAVQHATELEVGMRLPSSA